MTPGIFLLIVLAGAVLWLWLDGARARELATGLARQVCQRYGFQFLDGTAALEGVSLRWTRQGVRLRRVFRFDYSEAGVGRHSGHLTLVGIELEEFSLGLPGDRAGNHDVSAEGDDSRRLP